MYTVIIPAAGTGSRMGLGHNKLFYKVSGQTVIEHTVNKFTTDLKCKQIILTVSNVDLEKMNEIFTSYPTVKTVIGGESRQESIYNGLAQVTGEIVLIHDGARPFISANIIDACYNVVESGFGAIAAVLPKDTIKQRHPSKEDVVGLTLSRNELVAVQTPQAFPTSVLKKANELAKIAGTLSAATDDASLVEKYTDIDIKIVNGSYKNIKFTTPEDIEYFEFLLRKKECF